MKITNEVVEYNGKYYARADYVAGDMIPPKSIYSYDNGSIYHDYNMTYNTPTEASCCSYKIYIPIKVPEGYPDKWVVLKDNDVIGKDTLCWENTLLSEVGDHGFGKYSEVCKSFPMWQSYLMFNPAKTPQENYVNAEKDGIIQIWQAGEEIESSEDGKNWTVNSTPNFSLPLQWRMKTRPIVPPKFDWCPIIKGQEPKTKVLLLDGSNIYTGNFVSGVSRWYAFFGATVHPTHYTILDEIK